MMWTDKQSGLKRFFQLESGALSIMLTILVPIFMVGVLMLFIGLKEQQTNNRIRQMAYMSSEAYLSKINSYMWQSFRMQTNLDEGGLDQMIRHYITKNHLVVSPEAIEIKTTYESIKDPNQFKRAALNAMELLVIDGAAEYTVQLFERWKGLEKIENLNDKLSSYENELSEFIDQSEAIKMLNRLKKLDDKATQPKDLKVYGEIKAQQFENSYGKFTEVLKQSAQATGSEHSVNNYFEAKRQQSAQVKREVERLISALDEGANNLEKMIETINEESFSNESWNREIDAIIGQLGYDETVKMGGDIVSRLKQLTAELELTFSTVEIGDGQLQITSDAKKKFAFDAYEKETIKNKIILNEYFLMVFSSYDQKCPRKIDIETRPEVTRTVKGEIEFLISGESDEKVSVSEVRMKILAIRTLANLVSLMGDSNRINQLSLMTSTLPQPWGTMVFGATLAAWSTIESYGDVNALMKGEIVPFIKTSNQWRTALRGSYEDKKFDFGPIEQSDEMLGDFEVYYQDYLRLLLILQNEENTIARAMQLVEHELVKSSKGSYTLEDLSIGHSVSLKWQSNKLLDSENQMDAGMDFSNGQYP